MKRKFVRNIIGGLSFTSALFIFQACYGTPQDMGADVLIEGQVLSKSTGLPLSGIKVSVAHSLQFELTDADGKFSFYTELQDTIQLQFQDIDSTTKGLYTQTDTIITETNRKSYFAIELEEKND